MKSIKDAESYHSRDIARLVFEVVFFVLGVTAIVLAVLFLVLAILANLTVG